MNFNEIAEEAADEIWYNRASLEWKSARDTIKQACEKAYALGMNKVLQERATASEQEAAEAAEAAFVRSGLGKAGLGKE